MSLLEFPPCERTAAHESAHAVVAELLGIRIEHVSIVPRADTAGRVTFPPGKPTAERVAATLAGGLMLPRGEHLSSNEASPSDFDHAGDDALAVSLRVTRGHADASTVLEQARKRASELIHEHREVIHAGADALLERGELTGDELRAEMKRAVESLTPEWFLGDLGQFESMKRERELEKIGVTPSRTSTSKSRSRSSYTAKASDWRWDTGAKCWIARRTFTVTIGEYTYDVAAGKSRVAHSHELTAGLSQPREAKAAAGKRSVAPLDTMRTRGGGSVNVKTGSH